MCLVMFSGNDFLNEGCIILIGHLIYSDCLH
jgi:hypothetical protein